MPPDEALRDPHPLASRSEALESEPIALYGLESAICASRSCQHQEARTQFLVQNLAYEKQVSVHLRSDDWPAVDLVGHFVRSLPNGLELWAAAGPARCTPNCGTFSVSATVTQAGATHRTAEQRIAGCGDWSSRPVRVARIPGPDDARGVIVVARIAYEKEVTVVYSTDSGASWKTRSATFLPWSHELGFERWSFLFTPEERQTDISFAVAYKVDGKTFWDNNFGMNYLVPGLR